MEKAKFMFPVEYTLMVYSLSEKRHGLWKIVFPGGNDHGKRLKKLSQKIQCQSKLVLRIKWSGPE